MAGVSNENDDNLNRVTFEVNAGGDHQAITAATNKEVAIIIANEPNGTAKSARTLESTSQNHREPSKVVQGLKSDDDKIFKCCPDGFCEMVGRHKARNEQLSERESELRQRLATLESWIPAVTLIKMLTGEVDSSNIFNIIDEQAMTMSTSNAHLHTSLSQHKDSRIRDIEAERKEAHRRLEEARKLLREKQSAVDERAKQIEEAQRKHMSLEQKISQLQEQFERNGIDLMKVTSGESIASFGPDDLACIIKLEELVAAEEHTKRQVEELERREEAYMKTLKAAGHVIPKDRNHPEVDGLRDQLEVKSVANQQMADRICLLEDQVENLKGKLARCNDYVDQLSANHNKQRPITKNGGVDGREDGRTTADKGIMAKSTTVSVAAGSDHDTVKRSERGIIATARTDSKETLTRVELTDRSIQEGITDNFGLNEERPERSQTTHDHSILAPIHGSDTSVTAAGLSVNKSALKKQGRLPQIQEGTSGSLFDSNISRQPEGRSQQLRENSDFLESSGVTMSSDKTGHSMGSTTRNDTSASPVRQTGPASVRFEQPDDSSIQAGMVVREESMESSRRNQRSGGVSFASDHASIDTDDNAHNISLRKKHGMLQMDPNDSSRDEAHPYRDIPPMTSPQSAPPLSSPAAALFDDSQRSMRSDTRNYTGDSGRSQQSGRGDVSFGSVQATIGPEDNEHNIRLREMHGLPRMATNESSLDQSHPFADISPMTSPRAAPPLSPHAATLFDHSGNSMRSGAGNFTGDSGRSQQSRRGDVSFRSDHATIDQDDDAHNIRLREMHGMLKMAPNDGSFNQGHQFADIPPMTSPQAAPPLSPHAASLFDHSENSMRSGAGNITGDSGRRQQSRRGDVSFRSDHVTIDPDDDAHNIRLREMHGMLKMAPNDGSFNQGHQFADIPPMTSPQAAPPLSSHAAMSFDDSERSMRAVPGYDTSDQRAGQGGTRDHEADHERDDRFVSLKSTEDSTGWSTFRDNSSSRQPEWGKYPTPPPFPGDESGGTASGVPWRGTASPGRREQIADPGQADRIVMSRVQLEMWLAIVTDIRRQISRCPACQAKQHLLVQMCVDLCHHLQRQPNICMEESAVAHGGRMIGQRVRRPTTGEGLGRSSEYEDDSARDLSVGYPIGMSTRIEDDLANSPQRRDVSRIIDYTDSTFSDVNDSRQFAGRQQSTQDGVAFVTLPSTLGSDSGGAGMMPMSMNDRDRVSARQIGTLNREIQPGDPLRSHINPQSQHNNDNRFVSLKSTLDSTGASNTSNGVYTSGDRSPLLLNDIRSVPLAPIPHNRSDVRIVDDLAIAQPRIVSDVVLQDPGRRHQIAGRTGPRLIGVDAIELAIWRENITDIRRFVSRCPLCRTKRRALVAMCKAICEHLRVPSNLCDDDGQDYGAPIVVVPRGRADAMIGKAHEYEERTLSRGIERERRELPRQTDSVQRDQTIDLVSTLHPTSTLESSRGTLTREQPAVESLRGTTAQELYDSRDITSFRPHGQTFDLASTLESTRGAHLTQQSLATNDRYFDITDSTRYGGPPIMDPITGQPFGTSTPIRRQRSGQSPRTRSTQPSFDPDMTTHSHMTDSTRYGEPPIMDPITGQPFGTSTPIRRQRTGQSPQTRSTLQSCDPDMTVHSHMTDSTRYGEPPIMDPITGQPFGTSTPIRRQRTGQSPQTRSTQPSFDPDMTTHSHMTDSTRYGEPPIMDPITGQPFGTSTPIRRQRTGQSSQTRSTQPSFDPDMTTHSHMTDSTRYGEPPIMDPITGQPFGTSTPIRRQRTGQSPQTRSTQPSFDPDMTTHSHMTDSTRYGEPPIMDPITGQPFGTSTSIRRQRSGQSPRTRSTQQSCDPDMTEQSPRQHYQTLDSTQYREPHEMDFTEYREPTKMDPITGTPFGTSTPKRRKKTEPARRESVADDEDIEFLDEKSSYMTNGTGGRLQFGLEEMRGESSSKRRNYTETSIGPMIRKKMGKGRTFDESSDKKIPILGGLSSSQDQIFQEAPSSPYVLSDSESQRDSRSEEDERRERWRREETRYVSRPIPREQSKRITREVEKDGREYRKPLRKKDIISDTERSSISGPSTSHVQRIPHRSCCICPFPQIPQSEHEQMAFGDNCRPCPDKLSDPIRHKPVDIKRNKTKQNYPKKGRLITSSSMKTQTAIRPRDVDSKHLSDFDCEVCDCEPCGIPSSYYSSPGKTRINVGTNVSSRPTKRNRSVSAKKARTNG